VVFTTPAIRALRRHFPGARLCYLVEGAAVPVVAGNPHLSEVIVADRPRGLSRVACDLRLARRLRAERFDIVIDFHGGPRSALLTAATGARVRIGYALPGRQWVYTTRVPWTRSLVPPRHSVLSQWDLLRPLGIGAPDPARDAVEIAVDAAADARVVTRLCEAGVPEGASIVAMHVSAGNPFRRWPATSFATVAARLAEEAHFVIVTSGPSDAFAATAVADEARRLSTAPDRVVRCGEFDLAELRALVERAAVYIGGDSGPLHIASASRTPVVAIFGPTLPERSLPWRDPAIPSVGVDAGPLPCRPCHQRTCVPGDFRCLTGIAAEQVIAAARTLAVRR
jgi:ADP-heptose:LPS heptosyltransferase